jgi:hypothetical protein
MTTVTILFRWYVTRRFGQLGPVREEFTDMTAFAAARETLMYRCKERRRGKDTG